MLLFFKLVCVELERKHCHIEVSVRINLYKKEKSNEKAVSYSKVGPGGDLGASPPHRHIECPMY